MLRYKNLGVAISVDLQNGFEVIAMASWNKIKQLYEMKMYIDCPEIQSPDEAGGIVELLVDQKYVKSEMARHITNKLTEGYFKYYIDRYEEQLEALDRGFSLLENGRC